MLFKELIEQHGVHRRVVDGVDLAFGIASHKVGAYLLHFLGDEAELRGALFVNLRLVAEGDWTQGQNRLTGGVHVGDVLLKAARGRYLRAELAVSLAIDFIRPARDLTEIDAADKAVIGIAGTAGVTDADRADIPILPGVADANVIRSRDDILAGLPTEGDVAGGRWAA